MATSESLSRRVDSHAFVFREFLCNRACYGHELWQVTARRRVTSSNQVETFNGVSTGKPTNQRLMQYGSGSEHGQVNHECSRRNQAGRHGGVRRRNALEAVVKDTTLDYNAWRHNAIAAQRHTTDNVLALLRAKRQ